VFIIANIRGERRLQVFPIREDSQPDIVLPTLTARYYGGQANGGYIGYKQAQDLKFMYGIMGDKNKMWLEGGGWGAKTGLYEIPETAQALQTDGQSRTGTSWGTNKPQSARSIRRLTPIECERLQGFPDNWTKYGIDKNGEEVLISDSQRYKMCGNAVTTNVITEIGKRLAQGVLL
jgi:DNA (cytosine-5)-methyltransferase 1